jgi:CheY-like chemotaxis protein
MPTILLVEDDRDMRNVLSDLLQLFRYSVIPAIDGQVAVEKLSEGIAPDLILSDWHMPKMNGEELLRTLSDHPEWQSIPIIVMSGQREDETPALENGAGQFLHKPIRAEQLREAVKKILGE